MTTLFLPLPSRDSRPRPANQSATRPTWPQEMRALFAGWGWRDIAEGAATLAATGMIVLSIHTLFGA